MTEFGNSLPRHYKYFENEQEEKLKIRNVSRLCWGCLLCCSQLELRVDERALSMSEHRETDNAEYWDLVASGYGKKWGRSPHQSILVFLADSHLWEKAFFIDRIFSKPRCHTEEHTFNKRPFLTSLLIPPLPFGRGEDSIYNVDFHWELQMSPVSAETAKHHWEGCVKSYKEGYSEGQEVFPGWLFLAREDFICSEAARQMSTLQWASPCFSRNIFYMELTNADLILAGMN